MSVFAGRRDVHLSPDGSVVVLDGDAHFGTSFLRSTSYMEKCEDEYEGGGQVVASVYLNGELWREITYEGDLKGPRVPADPTREIGGGWARRREALELEVDWEGRTLTLHSCRVAEDNGEVGASGDGDASPSCVGFWLWCCCSCFCGTSDPREGLPKVVRGETLLSLALPMPESSEPARSDN